MLAGLGTKLFLVCACFPDSEPKSRVIFEYKMVPRYELSCACLTDSEPTLVPSPASIPTHIILELPAGSGRPLADFQSSKFTLMGAGECKSNSP